MRPCRREPVRWISSWKLFFDSLGTLWHKISDALVCRADGFLCHNRLELALIYQFYVKAFSLSFLCQLEPGITVGSLSAFLSVVLWLSLGIPLLGHRRSIIRVYIMHIFSYQWSSLLMRSIRIPIRISLFITFNSVLYFLLFLWYCLMSTVR